MVFCAIEIPTVPLPVPLAPALTVIQDAFDVATHPQLEAAITLTLAAPPVLPRDVDVPLSEYVHGAADCWTVNVCPAMVTLPVREDVVVFCVIERLTVPLPVPLAPALTVIQEAFDVATQEQLDTAVTLTLAAPPVLPKEVDVPLSE